MRLILGPFDRAHCSIKTKPPKANETPDEQEATSKCSNSMKKTRSHTSNLWNFSCREEGRREEEEKDPIQANASGVQQRVRIGHRFGLRSAQSK